jgi:hypothetical protein
VKTIFTKVFLIFPTIILILAPKENLSAQSFANLDFEAANIPSSTQPSSTVPISESLRGWSGYIGGVQQTVAYYDISALDTSRISIIDHDARFNQYPGVLQGNYTALLSAGLGGDTTLSQTGLVPFGTQSLLFRAFPDLGSDIQFPGSFAVTLGGQTLALTVLGSGTNYTWYGADINSWANQTTDLNFTLIAQKPYNSRIYFLSLDSIQFSTQPIPEPSGLALLGVGALLLDFFCRRNSSR